MMHSDNLPAIPCTFGNSWYGSSLSFDSCGVAVSWGGDGQPSGHMRYIEIESVKVKPTKYFLGLRVGPTILEFNRTKRTDSLNSSNILIRLLAAFEPEQLDCYLDNFKHEEWPIIFKLIRFYSPQAQFDEWAIQIMNARDEIEIKNLKI